jgi:hypothetical protein
MGNRQRGSRCRGKTKAGNPCRAAATAGGLCFFHANPAKARTLGQIGGRRNRSRLPEAPAACSLSAADARDTLSEAVRDVRSKKMTPRAASSIAQLCNSLHRFLQTADMEARLARLEQQLAEQGSSTSVDTDPTGSRNQEETRDGAHAQTGGGLRPESDEAQGMDDESSESGEA